jgi:hypothetical protein
MRALSLSTRLREGAFEGAACLLVYDEIELSAAAVSSDVRDLLDAKPNTSWIYVLAPYLAEPDVLRATLNDQVYGRAGDKVWVLSYRAPDGQTPSVVRVGRRGLEQVEEPLPTPLQNGWLFDLFDKSKGKVTAPPGVHFGKTSGKHSTVFLRAGNALLSTKASGLLAFFLMASLPKQDVRRILVDTAPLLSVAHALIRIAEVHCVWSQRPPASSFSSYGGLDALSRLHKKDLVIISASTSGGLAERLIGLGASSQMVATLFSLSEQIAKTQSPIICDLKFQLGLTFGYLPIENQTYGSCKWCDQGFLLAPLEGDQFLLEKRPIKRLRVSKAEQPPEARKLLERWTRNGYFKVDPYGSVESRSLFVFDSDRAIAEDGELRAKLIRQLQRYAPTPLHVVVLIGLSRVTYEALIEEAGLGAICATAEVIEAGQVSVMTARPGAGVLVLVGRLGDHGLLRRINAQLRTKASNGCIAYLAAFTLADSKKGLTDLDMFLTYGEHGKETFTFKSAESLLLPWRASERTSWDEERLLLQQIRNDSQLVPALAQRLDELESFGVNDHALFLRGKDTNALAIAPDFVYLDTKIELAKISQADIFLVVCNLLAVARSNGLQSGLSQDHQFWAQSVYGQVLVDLPAVCPRNFRDYNDAILRASFLRAASKQELNYSVDEECSGEVLDVLRAEIDAWPDGRGDSLPELLMALATRRLRLTEADEARLITHLNAAKLPEHLEQLRCAWVSGRF